jgi:hypothetical protein
MFCLKPSLVQSLLQRNETDFAVAADWELEWSTNGIKSGLSQKDYRKKKQQQIRQRAYDKVRFFLYGLSRVIACQLRTAFAYNDAERSTFEDFVKGFAGGFVMCGVYECDGLHRDLARQCINELCSQGKAAVLQGRHSSPDAHEGL